MLSYVAVRNNAFTALVGIVVFSALIVSEGQQVQAVASDTDISVNVCGNGAPPAQIAITEPLSDSVVNQPVITLRGTADNTSQIELRIDNQYSGTVALGANQTSFETDLSLTAGTHTITAKANGICGTAPATTSVIVTYQPTTLPSGGSTTPTELGPEAEQTGVTEPAMNETITDNDFARTIQQLPVVGAAVSIIADFAASVGLENTVVGNNTPVVAGAARVGFTVVALTSVVMAGTIAPLAAQAVPGIAEAFNVTSPRSMMYLGWIIRGIGVLTMALAYFV